MRIPFSRFCRRLLTGILCLSLLFTGVPLCNVTAEGEPKASSVSVTFTNPITTNGGITMTASGKGDSAYTFSVVDDTSVMTVDKYAYFQVTDAALCAAAELTVTVKFYDTASTVMLQ